MILLLLMFVVIGYIISLLLDTTSNTSISIYKKAWKRTYISVDGCGFGFHYKSFSDVVLNALFSWFLITVTSQYKS